jgi:glycosyltransferase involved in cell wall biosynthesis
LVDYIIGGSSYGRTIFFLPPVPTPDVCLLASSADVGVCLVSPTCLSYNYCMPNKLFQYISSGLPVLVSNCSSLAEFVSDHNIGLLLEDTSPISIAKTIKAVTASDIRLFSRNALIAAKQYSWGVQLETIRTAYELLLSPKNK